MNKTIAITGANGYVGSHIVTYLRNNNLIVYKMARKNNEPTDAFFIPYQLAGDTDYSKLQGIDVLIHCAYDFSDKASVNIKGSLTLFEQAKNYGVKHIIFISSMSAFPGVKSTYGQTKLKIEEDAQKIGAIIIRPGLIFSKNMRSIFGAINKIIQYFPFVPLIGRGKQIFYPCHVDDLCQLILTIIKHNSIIKQPIIAAANQPITFKEILNILAKSNGKNIICIPIPYDLLYYVLVILEKINCSFGIRSDSLKSIQSYNPQIDFQGQASLKVPFRNFTPETLT